MISKGHQDAVLIPDHCILYPSFNLELQGNNITGRPVTFHELILRNLAVFEVNVFLCFNVMFETTSVSHSDGIHCLDV